MPSPKKSSLRKISASDYKIGWNRSKDVCTFSSGKTSGDLPCGACDAIFAYKQSSPRRIIVLSVNYPHSYAAIHVFEHGSDEYDASVFADPSDISKIYGDKFPKTDPKEIASRLFRELR